MTQATTEAQPEPTAAGAFAGKRALVTGAGRGIGLAIAEMLAARGASVMLCDLDAAACEAAAGQLGADARWLQADVTAPGDVAGAVQATVSALGGVDILVNNAGIEIAKPLTEHSEEEFARVLDVNVKGVFYGMKHAVGALAADGGGAIVNIASVASLNGAPLLAAYTASKAAVLQLTRVGAIEFRDLGVRVNAVCPGLVQTQMLESLRGPIENAAGIGLDEVLALKQGRAIQPDEIAEAVCFLASDAAPFTTGAHYVLDGGLTASLF